MSKKAQQLAARYGKRSDILEIVKEIIEEQYHVNAFSNPEYPVIIAEPEIQTYHWGLIPHWIKPKHDSEIDYRETVERAQRIQKGELNARAETIFEKPSFRYPILSHRCIIPSTGYFEYHHNEDKTTTPYYIYLKDEEIFSMGGIYDAWVNPMTGELVHTFSMITTPGNDFTNKIHNGGKNPFRMPLILSPEDENRWLDPKLPKPEIEKLLKPFDPKPMDAYIVKPDFVHKRSHDKSILERA